MPPLHHLDIGLLDWDYFIAELETSSWSTLSPSRFESAMNDYFGIDLTETLRALIIRARTLRARFPLRGNVVLVPGTMCSLLNRINPGSLPDMVWLNALRVALGELELLKLDNAGTGGFDPAVVIANAGVIKYAYAITVIWLYARWNVRAYGYDWRMDIDQAADGLANFIQTSFPGQPVHIVAHSMGGLVSRNFIRRHASQWESLQGPDPRRGGRLVLLGTPNYGSFLATQSLAGEGPLVQAINLMDVAHDTRGILDITDTFPGIYELLPAIGHMPIETEAIYTQSTWGALPVSATHLARATQLQTQLASIEGQYLDRIYYIAGYGLPTPSGLSIIQPGVFRHSYNFHGDAVVTHALGLIPGVPAWYAFTDHFTMVARPRILLAVEDILHRGRTWLLPRKPLPLVRRNPLALLTDQIAEVPLEREMRNIALRASRGTAGPAEIHRLERVVNQRMFGDRRSLRQLALIEAARLRDLFRGPATGEAPPPPGGLPVPDTGPGEPGTAGTPGTTPPGTGSTGTTTGPVGAAPESGTGRPTPGTAPGTTGPTGTVPGTGGERSAPGTTGPTRGPG